MTQHASHPVGYLRSCMDRRFLEVTRSKFEEVTHLGKADYYHEAIAGGALNPNSNFTDHHAPTPNGADYVYGLRSSPDHPVDLVYMGWQVHLNGCGGLKDKDDQWIINEFLRLRDGRGTQSIQDKYPDTHVKHIYLVASLLDGQPVVRVY